MKGCDLTDLKETAGVSVYVLYTKYGRQYVLKGTRSPSQKCLYCGGESNEISVMLILLFLLAHSSCPSGRDWLPLTIRVYPVSSSHLKCVLAPLAPCSLGLFCRPAAAVTPHYSQSAKWNIILNICIVISPVTLTRTRVNKAINHSGTSKLFCNSS